MEPARKKTEKPTGVLENVMEDQKGCKKNNIRAEEEQITAARTKQHEDGEEDTGRIYRHKAGGEGKYGKKERNKARRTKQGSETTSVIASAFMLPPLNSTKTNKNCHSL